MDATFQHLIWGFALRASLTCNKKGIKVLQVAQDFFPVQCISCISIEVRKREVTASENPNMISSSQRTGICSTGPTLRLSKPSPCPYLVGVHISRNFHGLNHQHSKEQKGAQEADVIDLLLSGFRIRIVG